jgi:hypothetical protein
MNKLIAIALFIFSSAATGATRYVELGRQLYPQNSEDQAFVSKFFEIVEMEKTRNPLLNGRGPSISEYRLDKFRFAFMTDETRDTVDLAGNLLTYLLPEQCVPAMLRSLAKNSRKLRL